jgi:hypothetical protein
VILHLELLDNIHRRFQYLSLLRSGSSGIKMLAATVLWSLCKEELRVKVLLGGYIPPLLALLMLKSAESLQLPKPSLQFNKE